MNTFTKTIFVFSLIASSQAYSMFRLTRPVSRITRIALIKRLMSTEACGELKLIKQELEKLNSKIKENKEVNESVSLAGMFVAAMVAPVSIYISEKNLEEIHKKAWENYLPCI